MEYNLHDIACFTHQKWNYIKSKSRTLWIFISEKKLKKKNKKNEILIFRWCLSVFFSFRFQMLVFMLSPSQWSSSLCNVIKERKKKQNKILLVARFNCLSLFLVIFFSRLIVAAEVKRNCFSYICFCHSFFILQFVIHTLRFWIALLNALEA